MNKGFKDKFTVRVTKVASISIALLQSDCRPEASFCELVGLNNYIEMLD